MVQAVNSSLTIVGQNTSTPMVFWNGTPVPDVVTIRTDWDDDERRVFLRVKNVTLPIVAEMRAAGIIVKKERRNV